MWSSRQNWLTNVPQPPCLRLLNGLPYLQQTQLPHPLHVTTRKEVAPVREEGQRQSFLVASHPHGVSFHSMVLKLSQTNRPEGGEVTREGKKTRPVLEVGCPGADSRISFFVNNSFHPNRRGLRLKEGEGEG